MPSNLFDLTGKVAIITGGAGLLGVQHAKAIASFGGKPIIADIDSGRGKFEAEAIRREHGSCGFVFSDVSKRDWVETLLYWTIASYGKVDILINNACRNPKMIDGQTYRLETFGEDEWDLDLAVGLKSYFLCSKVIGSYMASKSNRGVIVNIASDLSVIAPDQRLYRKEGLADDQQPVKPISYSVVKHGIIGMTKYLATYWAGKVRVNALSPGGVYNNQPDDFVKHVSNLIPMGRMAKVSEMQGALVFLCSDASSYITGINLVVDGGRTII